MLWIYIVIAIVIIMIICALVSYNGLVKLNTQAEEAFSTMDIYLKKRWDLIPNIIEVVKGYAKHEKDLLKDIAETRKSTYNRMSDEEKIKTNEQLSNNVDKIIALAEAYPVLKANENFIDLSNQLSKIEDEIANSRKYYNGVVKNYNNKVKMFPSNIFAKMFGYKARTMFEAAASEKKSVKVEL